MPSSPYSPTGKTVIGMLHLPPLPGSARFGVMDANATRKALQQLRDSVLADADALVTGGIHGLMLENFGDVPFYPKRVPANVVSHMTAIACAITERFDVPLGINVLRNDGCSALAIAAASGAAFIRVNVLCGARVTDQGILEGIAHDLLRDRTQLGATDVQLFADVDVKHSTAVGDPLPIEFDVKDTLQRGLADAVIVSGSGTGALTKLDHVSRAKGSAGDAPVFIGSGVNAENIGEYLSVADGVIVGSSLKQDGPNASHVDNPVDRQRVKQLIATIS